MVRWHATRGVSVIDFARSVVMINGILHLPQLSAMPALTEYGRRLEDPHPRGQVVQVSGRTIASCFKAITRDFIFNSKRGFLFLSLSPSLSLLLSMVHSLSLCLITQNQSLLDTLCTRNQKLAKSGNSQNILLKTKLCFEPSSYPLLRRCLLHCGAVCSIKLKSRL